MNCFDIYWYICGLLIMSFIFVCGYRIGVTRGYAEGMEHAEQVMNRRASRERMLNGGD